MDTASLPAITHRALIRLLAEKIALHAGQRIGLMLIRLNGYHRLNTTVSYAAGEQLVDSASAHLANEFRPIDTVTSLASGHIAVILPGMRNDEHALLAANKVMRALKTVPGVGGKASSIAPAIGVAVFPTHAGSPEATVQQADIALQQTVDPADPVRLACPVADPIAGSIGLLQSLETAIEQAELELFFQPKVSLPQRRITGVEALSRWTSATHGRVAPDVFIRLAESTGLIKPLTIWALNVALKSANQWRTTWPDASVAVNLSATVLHDTEIVDLVRRALNIWNVRPAQLTLEVTESAMMSDPGRCLATINDLHALGVRLAIDDFGTGYSSLAYLNNLCVDELKIDKSFVLTLASDANNAKIVQSIIDLAHNFKMQVVAEGVEDQDSCAILATRQCDVVQGYLIGKPMPEPDLRRWLTASPWSGLTLGPP